jgi:hypothetical protein
MFQVQILDLTEMYILRTSRTGGPAYVLHDERIFT